MFKTMMKSVLMLSIVFYCSVKGMDDTKGLSAQELKTFSGLSKKFIHLESLKQKQNDTCMPYEKARTSWLKDELALIGESATQEELEQYDKHLKLDVHLKLNVDFPMPTTTYGSLKHEQYYSVKERYFGNIFPSINNSFSVESAEKRIKDLQQKRDEIKQYLTLREKLAHAIKLQRYHISGYDIKKIQKNVVGFENIESFQAFDKTYKDSIDILYAPQKYKHYSWGAAIGALASGCVLVVSGRKLGFVGKVPILAGVSTLMCVGLAEYFKHKRIQAQNPGTTFNTSYNNLFFTIKHIEFSKKDINNIDGRAMMANYMSCKEKGLWPALRNFKDNGGKFDKSPDTNKDWPAFLDLCRYVAEAQ